MSTELTSNGKHFESLELKDLRRVEKNAEVTLSVSKKKTLEIIALSLVIVILGAVMTLPIIFYHLPVNIDEVVSIDKAYV